MLTRMQLINRSNAAMAAMVLPLLCQFMSIKKCVAEIPQYKPGIISVQDASFRLCLSVFIKVDLQSNNFNNAFYPSPYFFMSLL